MSARRLFVAILTVFAVGAAVVYSARASRARIEHARAESNRLIAASEAMKRELNERFGITLTPLIENVSAPARAREFDWSRFSLAERQVILAKLFAHVNTVGRIFEITAQDGLRLEGGAGDLKKSADAAWAFYLSGKSFGRARAGSTKANRLGA
jgi:hypothetical protein